MENPILLCKICLVLCITTFVVTLGEYLALHDIWNDYVSEQVVKNYTGEITLSLPDWTKTKLEWQMVNISGLIKIVYLIFSFVTLIICQKVFRNKV